MSIRISRAFPFDVAPHPTAVQSFPIASNGCSFLWTRATNLPHNRWAVLKLEYLSRYCLPPSLVLKISNRSIAVESVYLQSKRSIVKSISSYVYFFFHKSLSITSMIIDFLSLDELIWKKYSHWFHQGYTSVTTSSM